MTLISESTQQQLHSDRRLRQDIHKMIESDHLVEPRKIIVVDIR